LYFSLYTTFLSYWIVQDGYKYKKKEERDKLALLIEVIILDSFLLSN
jgi:hypothetical protein